MTATTTEAPQAAFDAMIAKLTRRERQVVTMVLDGYRVPDIAAALDRSPSTVRNQVSTACRQLGVVGQAGLVSLLRPVRADRVRLFDIDQLNAECAGVPCRQCHQPTLRVELRTAVGKPGRFTLAATPVRFSPYEWPWMKCDTCGAECKGTQP